MSEMPRNTSELTPDLVQALRYIRSRKIIQGTLRFLVNRPQGALTNELGQFVRQRGYVTCKMLGRNWNGHFNKYARAVQMNLLTRTFEIRSDSGRKRKYVRFHITDLGKMVLHLYDTIDLSEL